MKLLQNFTKSSIAVVLISSFFAQSAWAMRFYSQNICDATGCQLVLIGEGLIDRNSAENLKSALTTTPNPKPILELHSLGGDLAGGIALGQTIRQNNLNTRVRYQVLQRGDVARLPNLAHAQCHSACLLAFMGGVQRELDPRANIGLHALQGDVGKAESILKTYVQANGVQVQVLDYLKNVRGQAINLIPLNNAIELAVVTRPMDYALSDRISTPGPKAPQVSSGSVGGGVSATTILIGLALALAAGGGGGGGGGGTTNTP